MTAIARQTNVIEIKGVDNASKAINKASASMARLQKQTKKTGDVTKSVNKDLGEGFVDAGDAAAGRAGKLSTALSSLGDFAGKSEGSFRVASEAAGAFDDVLTLLPGPIGLAAAAAAGLTTILVLQAKAAREDKAAIDLAFGPNTSRGIRKVGEDLNLSRDAMLALGQASQDTNKPLSQMQDDLRAVVARAEEVGEDGSEAVLAFARSLSEGVTDADRLRGRLRALGIEVKQIDLGALATGALGAEAAKAGAKAEATLKSLGATLKVQAQRVKDIQADRTEPEIVSGTGVARQVQRQNFAAAKARKLAKAKAAEDETKAEITALKNRQERLSFVLIAAEKKNAALLKREAATARAEAVTFNEELAKDRERRESARRKAAGARARAERSKIAAAAKAQRERDSKALEASVAAAFKLEGARLDTQELELKAAIALADNDADRIKLARQLNDLLRKRALLRLSASGEIDGDQFARRKAAIEALGKVELDVKIKSIKDNADKEKAEREKQQRDQIAAQITSFAAGLSAIEIGETGSAINDLQKGFAAAATGAADVVKNIKNIPKATAAAAGAVGVVGSLLVDASTRNAEASIDADTKQRLSTAKTEAERAAIVEEGEKRKAAAVEKGERRKAAILAVMEVARGIASVASGNYVEAAAHGAAAVAFGAIAGGAGGTTAPSGGGGGFATTGQATGQGGAPGAPGGQGITQVFNFNQPLVTQQVIGKAAAEAQRSIAMTGLDKAKGA